jgi:outer membrane biosynthesis protein TonB
MSLRKTYLLVGFVALALLGLALADTGETVSEAAPLLGFTDTPVPVATNTPPPPPPTNTPPPPPPTNTPPPPQPTNTPRPQQKQQPVPTPTAIPILPESGHPEEGPVSPWMVGGIALLLGWLVIWSGQRHGGPSRPPSEPPSQ